MEALRRLNRSEMKDIMAGYRNECASGCLTLYGGYYEECGATYHASTDNWGLCVDEVRSLNHMCINGCF